MLLLLFLSTLAITSFLPASLAIPIHGYIQPNAHLSRTPASSFALGRLSSITLLLMNLFPSMSIDVDDLRPSTRVTLDHGAQYAYVLKGGLFSLSVELPSSLAALADPPAYLGSFLIQPGSLAGSAYPPSHLLFP
jgi:hypothetical protein